MFVTKRLQCCHLHLENAVGEGTKIDERKKLSTIKLNSLLFSKNAFFFCVFAITCFSVTPYELGRQNQIALTFSCYQRKKIVYVKYSTPLHSQKLRFLFSVFRDRMLFGDPIRVGTAQKYSLNITLSCYQREKIVYEKCFKSN